MEKLICTECGAEMNHHANKVEYKDSDLTLNNGDFGGALEEIHTCTNCGHILMRPARS